MKKIILTLCLFTVCIGFSQTEENDKKAIQKVLKKQRLAWSKNDIEGFMEGYWKSDSLTFYGANGVVNGWVATLKRYQRAYPTEDHTGILSFKINAINKIEANSYYVLGEYHIKREVGNADGFFMVVFKKINGEWKIIADTSG
ncbi:YybH family protein [Neotamlana laminarinivorans]|uniref:Nuclear transport factor 2 family protein n=1 Tax=Neotamlana laminarinivorans TaxID=2883124 RepID=A0A9X1HZP0_9FLAO|nr:nuclear transport factor 2 family protein [Tamlana laminarinivorans]MCB4799103.1 nuclear transport factor 2 family protein [Tamlana laminarinivorans]